MMPGRQNLAKRVAGLLDERRDQATRPSFRQQAAVGGGAPADLAGRAFLRRVANRPLHAQVRPNQQASEKPSFQMKPVMPVPGIITGKVVNATDRGPVSGAGVWMMPAEDRFPRDTPKRQTKTNAQGEFEFDAVPPGRYRVASMPGNLTSRLTSIWWRRNRSPGERQGQTAALENEARHLRLREGSRSSGRQTDPGGSRTLAVYGRWSRSVRERPR